MYRTSLISLGCAKNEIDSEIVLGMLPLDEFIITQNISEADFIIVNTCGFILDSKKESIDVISELEQYRKEIFVIGCLSQRYQKDLEKSFDNPRLHFVKIAEYHRLNEIINEVLGVKNVMPFNPLNRLLPPHPYSAYLRISEGCSNHCYFCAIPLIRGPFRSRKKEDILFEAKWLKAKGVKEIILISQDSSHYGIDLYDNYRIEDLLEEIAKMNFLMVRLLYLYVDAIDLPFIATMKKYPNIMPYFDLPFQHASNRILKAMNRHGNKEGYLALIKKIKEAIPRAILRSTFIVGYPGETKEDFLELIDFISEVKFDHLGAFTYSKEEGTVAFNLPKQVNEKTKLARLKTLMNLQKKISFQKNKEHIGERMEALVVNDDPDLNYYLVRSYFNAPDGVDGNIYLLKQKDLKLGEVVHIKIVDCSEYDLFAELE